MPEENVVETGRPPLHAGQPPVDAVLVRQLLARQHAQWADLPVRRIASNGTTNAIFRIGDALSARMPLVAYGEDAIDKEARWLPALAPHLPLAMPEPVAAGDPGAGYPFRWSVHTWLEGEELTAETAGDPAALAVDLAGWIRALHAVDTSGGPDALEHRLRGVPLATRDEATRRGIAALGDEVDADRALADWDEALRAPAWERPGAWFHGDLLPGNLLVREGRLAAVLDFASCGVGDPACDLMFAWALPDHRSRDAFRSALGVDDATWMRGRGQALYHAAIYIPYYRDSNPAGTAAVRRLLDAVLAEDGDT
jgi:aminoglycoside phosphotransferase (APT) family kinase protein